MKRYMVETRSNRWAPREDDLFRRMAEANTRPELIAPKLNRSAHAIKARAYTIGLPLKRFKLTAEEMTHKKPPVFCRDARHDSMNVGGVF